MNKTELINQIAEKADLTKKDSEKALNALIETVTEALKAGDEVQLVGFGSFQVKQRAARDVRIKRPVRNVIYLFLYRCFVECTKPNDFEHQESPIRN